MEICVLLLLSGDWARPIKIHYESKNQIQLIVVYFFLLIKLWDNCINQEKIQEAININISCSKFDGGK